MFYLRSLIKLFRMETILSPIIRREPKQQVPAIQIRQLAEQKSKKDQLIGILTDVIKNILNSENELARKGANQTSQKDQQELKDEGTLLNLSPPQPKQPIIISNDFAEHRSSFGQIHKEKLDCRDNLLIHPYLFQLVCEDMEQITTNGFLHSKSYNKICCFIRQFLADALQNIASISFRYLLQGQLKEREVKDYASKNILLNVHSIFKEVMKALIKHQIIKEKQKKTRKNLEFAFAEYIDQTLKQILINLLPYYPQSPPTGGTPRMRDALLAIDRSQNEQLDFLYTQNIRIKKKEKNGDYTAFIMKVINKAIEVTEEIDEKDYLQQTIFEKFKGFSENLFWTSQQDNYAKVLKKLNSKNDNKGQKNHERNTRLPIHHASSSFDITGLQASASKQRPQNDIKKDLALKIKRITPQSIVDYLKKPVYEDQEDQQSSFIKMSEVLPSEETKEKKIEHLRNSHQFLIGQKLPSSLKPFNSKDITDKRFTAKHSIILRFLTKWAENLENIFDDPELYTINRIYPFKNLNHEIVYLSIDMKKKLYEQLVGKKKEKERIKEHLITKNKYFQGSFVSQTNKKNVGEFIKRYTETRVMASKMNALVIHFMQQYVSELIRMLVEVGSVEIHRADADFRAQYSNQSRVVKTQKEEINLVVFKIGDLMRSKIHCNEATFIRLLKTLYILDQAEDKEEPLFELVRIKNKLDTKDNNILINYLFMGKVQCELQISTQSISGKEEHYYNFNHFLYELTRGKFGVLSQCASIISHYDPIVASLQSEVYHEIKPKPKKKKELVSSFSLIKSIYEMNKQKTSKPIFVCQQCDKLKPSQNRLFLKKSISKKTNVCNQCTIDLVKANNNRLPESGQSIIETHIEEILHKEQLSKDIIKYLEKGKIKKINYYQQLAKSQSPSLIFSINPLKNEIQYSLLIYEESEFQWYLARINMVRSEFFQRANDKIDYKNITKYVEKKQNMPEFTYLMGEINEDSIRIILSWMQKEDKELKFDLSNYQSKIMAVYERCRNKIDRDILEDTFRNKKQTLSINQKILQADILQEINESNAVEKRWVLQGLSHIQFIYAENLMIDKLPQWLERCKNVKTINLNHNKIESSAPFQSMLELKTLILKENLLKYVEFSMLHKLESLNISYNQLTSIKQQNLPKSLRSIDLGVNLFEQIFLTDFPFLEKLELYGNKLNKIDIKGLKNIQYLDVSRNNLTQIVLKDLEELNCLDVSYNQIVTFELINLPNLTTLRTHENPLSNILFEHLLTLSSQSFTSNKIEAFKCKNLPDVHYLIIQNSPLKELILQDLGGLIHLKLKNNASSFYQIRDLLELQELQITECHNLLQVQINNLPSLRELRVIDTASSIFNIGQLTSLKRIKFIGNQLNTITDVGMQNLEFLEEIHLQNNIVQPFNYSVFKTLKQLCLINTGLVSLSCIQLPQSLEVLSLAGNLIEQAKIQGLLELRKVSIGMNARLIKTEFINLPKLRHIDFEGITLPAEQIYFTDINLAKLQIACDKESELQILQVRYPKIAQFKKNDDEATIMKLLFGHIQQNSSQEEIQQSE